MSATLSNCVRQQFRLTGGWFVLLAALMAGGWFVGGRELIGRAMWMDEVHSWLLITDQDSRHAFEALADGVDFNPPGWFILTRCAIAVVGDASPAGLRSLSVLWMLLAATGLYLLLMRTFGDWRVCTASVLLTFAHPLIMHQATEIRFYAFWCAAIVWLIQALNWPAASRYGQRLAGISAGVLTVLVTTCHYFGILSIVLILLPFIIRRHATRHLRQRAMIVTATSVISLALCLPFLIGQRAALTRPTWISPPTFRDSIDYVLVFLPAWKVCVLAAVGLTCLARRSRCPAAVRSTDRLPTLAGAVEPGSMCLSGAFLCAMPLVIVAVSWLLQPALVTRYAVVGLMGLSVVYAFGLAALAERWRSILPTVSLIALGWVVSNVAGECRTDTTTELQLANHLLRLPAETVIVCEDRIVFCRLMHSHPELSSRLALIDFADTELIEDSALRIVQRDAGRAMARWYPKYRMQALHSLAAHDPAVLVLYDGATSAGVRMPEHMTATVLATGLLGISHRQAAIVDGPASQFVPASPCDGLSLLPGKHSTLVNSSDSI